MSIGLIGQKCGMTRIFEENGQSIPVTVVQVLPNCVSQIKTEDTDRYTAVQIATQKQHPRRLSAARRGHLKKAGVEASRLLREFRISPEMAQTLTLGEALDVGQFEEGQSVDVQGVTRGKGFAGSVKRWGFGMQDATHGNSVSHRHLGSVGQCQDPGRVFKGKKMAGHMGNVNRTVKNQKIVKIDVEKQLILIKGCIPGAPNQPVVILPSTKAKGGKK